ncbi:MAG: helix-turn-helix transcriptional regulator [Flavobacteriaceae bacterium]
MLKIGIGRRIYYGIDPLFSFLALMVVVCGCQEKDTEYNGTHVLNALETTYLDVRDQGQTDKVYPLVDFILINDPKISDKASLAKLDYLMSVYYLNKLQLVQSKAYAEKSYSLALELNDLDLQASNLGTMSLVEAYSKDFTSAMAKSINAEMLYERIGSKNSLIDIYLNRMMIYENLGKWQESLNTGKKVVDLVDETGNKRDRLKYAYAKMAWASSYLKDSVGTFDFTAKAESLIQDEKAPNSDIRKLIEMAKQEVYRDRGDYKMAYDHMKNALVNSVDNSAERWKLIEKEFAFERELLNQIDEDRKKSLKRNHIFLVMTIAFLAISLLYTFYYRRLQKKLRNSLKESSRLNHELQNTLIRLQSNNLDLEKKQEHISKLMELNERTLFGKVFKLSTYKDALETMAKQVGKLVSADQPITPNKLLPFEKTLLSLISNDEIWEDFKIQFEKTRPGFFKKLSAMAGDLSINEMKHCTYVVSKLRIKEVANLINVSPRAVETARYRVKKKLGLGKDQSLYEFLQQI